MINTILELIAGEAECNELGYKYNNQFINKIKWMCNRDVTNDIYEQVMGMCDISAIGKNMLEMKEVNDDRSIFDDASICKINIGSVIFVVGVYAIQYEPNEWSSTPHHDVYAYFFIYNDMAARDESYDEYDKIMNIVINNKVNCC